MNEVITIGVDLTKNVFQVHGVDASGETVIRRRLRRMELIERTGGTSVVKWPECDAEL